MLLKARLIYLIPVMILLASGLNGQSQSPAIPITAGGQPFSDSTDVLTGVEVNAFYGFLIANQPKSLYLRNDHSRFIEVNVSRSTTGKHTWEKESNLPRIGIAFLFGELGSRQYLGKMTAFYPFVHFPILKTRRSTTTFRLGAGVGWVEKPYDKETNYKNLMIGTHINAVISMRLQSEWQLHRGFYMNAGIAFTHLSNGSVRLPNLGLNIPAITTGLRYDPTRPPSRFSRQKPSRIRRNNLLLTTGIAWKQTYPLESTVHVVKTANLELSRSMSSVSRVAAGLIVSYDPSLSSEIANAPTYIFDKSELQVQASVYGGYEHVVGRLSIPVQLGVYFYNNYMVSNVYQLIGLRYRFAERWLASVQLKAHFGKADYIQYGIGYKIF
jgi:lipid A 3-O-deacylase PagL